MYCSKSNDAQYLYFAKNERLLHDPYQKEKRRPFFPFQKNGECKITQGID
jgi:hypothetical protein